MKNTNLLLIYALTFGSLISSCSKDDDSSTDETIEEQTTVSITTEDISIEMDEITEIDNEEELTLDLAELADYITIENGADVSPSFSIKSQSVDGAFSIENGVLVLNDKSVLDYETNPEFTAVITVSVGDESKDFNITLTLNDVLESTWSIGPIEVGIYENPDAGQHLLTIALGDYDEELYGEPTITLSEQSHEDALRVEGRELYINDAGIFDYETNPLITSKFTVTDGHGTSMENTITISLIDVDEVSWTAENLTLTIDEHPNSGTVIGNIAPNTNDPDIVFSYSISQITTDLLAIDTNGDVIVNHGYLMDYETGAKTGNVTISDDQGHTQDITITVLLNNIQESSWGFNTSIGTNISIDENRNTSSPVADITQYLEDYHEGMHGALSYTVYSESVSGAFSVTNYGMLEVSDASLFDYETNPTFNVTVRATDEKGTSRNISLVVSLNDLSELSMPNKNVTLGGSFSPGDIAFTAEVYLDGVRIQGTDLYSNYVVNFSDYKINGVDTASSIIELNASGQIVLLNVLGSMDYFTATMNVTSASNQNLTTSANVLIRF